MAEPTVVVIPGVGAVTFPETMSGDEIDAASAKLYAGARERLAAANKHYDEDAALNANQNKSMLGHIADQFTPGKIVERGVKGAKGYAEGVALGAAGLVGAAVAAPLYVGDALYPTHIPQTIERGKEALKFGGALAYSAAQDPMETSNKAWDAFARFASDPENVGAAAGTYAGGSAVMRSPVGTASRQLLGKIGSSTANKIPGVAEWRAERAAQQAAGAVVPPAAATAPPETPLELTRRVRDEWRAAHPPEVPTSGNNVQAPVTAQPPPPTTPANTPPGGAAPAAPSPAVRAAVPIVRGLTTEQFNAVAKLPAEDRQLYVRLRGVGDTHAEALATLEHRALAEEATNARAMVGKEKAAMQLFGTSAPELQERIVKLAPGPSRPPIAGEMAGLDARFKAMLANPKMAWLAPLLGGATLGTLARKDAE